MHLVRKNDKGYPVAIHRNYFKKGIHSPFRGLSLLTKLVWTNGVFDIVHTGHLELFKFCQKQGHIVIVGVNSDESAKSLNKPHPLINNETDRAIMVASQKDVDYVVIFDEPDPVACLELIKPDFFIKGGDYRIEDLPANEKAVVESYGGEILVSEHVEGKSTSGIYEAIWDNGYNQGHSDCYHGIGV